MADYIGKKPRRKNGGIKIIAFLVAVLCAGCTYLYFDYIWPKDVYRQEMAKLMSAEEMVAAGCADNDTTCRERIARAVAQTDDNAFERALASALSSSEMKNNLRKAHADGSICFLIDNDDNEGPSDEELAAWLDSYGSAKFLDEMPLISHARSAYEARYLKPTPQLYQYGLLRTLRWHHLPFGETWRAYTLASRYLGWSALAQGVSQPVETTADERRVMEAVQQHPAYFTDGAIKRLEILAQRSLAAERLSKLRDSLRRFMRDVRELPLNDDRTQIELVWLSSRNDLPPWLKRRWAGPYVNASELADPWGCPITGIRIPRTGEMTLLALGSDCAVGGSGTAEDIELAITSYAPMQNQTETDMASADTDKPSRKKKKRRSIVLP